MAVKLVNETTAQLGAPLYPGDVTMTIKNLVGRVPDPFVNGTDSWYAQLVALNGAGTQSVIEYLIVTSISGSTFTITRGQEGSTAIYAPEDTQVTFRLSAAAL